MGDCSQVIDLCGRQGFPEVEYQQGSPPLFPSVRTEKEEGGLNLP
jgi:hypothetical protein